MAKVICGSTECKHNKNNVCRAKNIKIDYEKLSFEDAWCGRF